MRPPVALGVLALLASTACAAQTAPLTSRPHDLGSGRALARSVAGAAHCGGLEDYGLVAADHWDFTCQRGSELFLIRTGGAGGIGPGEVPAVVGTAYRVSPFSDAGARGPVERLTGFPGRLVSS